MSFVEVFPTEPVIATTRARLSHAPRRRSPPAPRTRRPARASPLRRASARRPGYARRRSPRRRDRPDRTRRESISTPVTCSAVALEPAEPAQLVERERDHARSEACSASRAASRSSNGIVRSANSCPCSAPLPAITTTSPSRAELDRARDRRAPIGLDLDVADRARDDLVDDRLRVLAARVVGRDDRRRRRARRRSAPSAAASRGRGRRRSRRRRSRAPSRARAPCAARLERDRLVRVVDDHRERLPLVDRLESSGHAAHRLEPARDRLVVDAEQPRRARARRARSRR